MDTEAFLEWLAEHDEYYINDDELREEWPEFYEEYGLPGVTMSYDPETGETLIPKRDYRQAVVFGQPLD